MHGSQGVAVTDESHIPVVDSGNQVVKIYECQHWPSKAGAVNKVCFLTIKLSWKMIGGYIFLCNVYFS